MGLDQCFSAWVQDPPGTPKYFQKGFQVLIKNVKILRLILCISEPYAIIDIVFPSLGKVGC